MEPKLPATGTATASSQTTTGIAPERTPESKGASKTTPKRMSKSKADSFERVGAAAAVAEVPLSQMQAAVKKMRALVQSGRIDSYYAAAIGATNDPAMKAEALALFSQLPVISTRSTPEELVRAGLWTVAPRGLAELDSSPRYVPGRQIMVEAKVAHDPNKPKDVLAYDPKGLKAVTYRATLVGDDPKQKNNFLVAIDTAGGGERSIISVTKESVFRLNQPHKLDADCVRGPEQQRMPCGFKSWDMDYTSLWARAKLAEIAIKMDSHVQKLDFTKTHTAKAGGLWGWLGLRREKPMIEVQQACVETVFRAIDMRYPRDDGATLTQPGRCSQAQTDIGRHAIRGTGLCIEQTTVLAGLLMPFAKALGFDMQVRTGSCYRFVNSKTKNPFRSDKGHHSWIQLTYRPSLKMVVCDRTWNQVNFAIDRAYGFPYGDRYSDEDAAGYSPMDTTSTDVCMSASIQSAEREYAKPGDGRENHI